MAADGRVAEVFVCENCRELVSERLVVAVRSARRVVRLPCLVLFMLLFSFTSFSCFFVPVLAHFLALFVCFSCFSLFCCTSFIRFLWLLFSFLFSFVFRVSVSLLYFFSSFSSSSSPALLL